MYEILDSNLRWDTSFITFAPQMSASIHGFRIFASSIFMVFIILLENDDAFELPTYLGT